ncbi:hypothetical protein MTBSS4_640002 [Magnetospirillum sp. SS-4]|nr:hypothetical protein MTBSS4_640002 [Magnetospirillum sp. SS-4]
MVYEWLLLPAFIYFKKYRLNQCKKKSQFMFLWASSPLRHPRDACQRSFRCLKIFFQAANTA